MSVINFKPEFFGKYILLDKIAAGGMAEVYRAKAPGADGIGKIIAIKRILPQYSAHADFIEMFKNEAKIAINLTQANIGQIYEFGVEEGNFFLGMEFIDGRNLRQILSRCTKLSKPMTVEQCVYIMSQISSGLDYAHRCTDKNTGQALNIIHRDMSPQNIMVSFEGEVKIVDFGIAKAESKIESTRAGTLKGKFGYMSPEQAEGLDLDARTDIFSTGIVLWELLTGERLFVANNEVNTIRKIRECHIPSVRKINPNIHEDLERITNKALARDRSLRYQTASELSRDLSRFLYKINPEFTPQDLSLFVKTLFKDEIIEDRQKVAEFAKIQFAQLRDDKTQILKDGKTSATKTTTYTETGEVSAPEAPKNFIGDVGSKIKLKDISIKVDRGELIKKTTGRPPPGMPRTQQNHDSEYFELQSLRKEGSFVKQLGIVLTVFAVGFGYYYVKKYPQQAAKFLNSTKLPAYKDSTKNASKVVAVPQPEIAQVFVYSIPAGAQISVDERQVGYTPAEVSIPLKHKVNLALRRDGYMIYSKDFIATKSPDEFRATLQKVSTGYLDIDVQPSNSDIYINGQKLAERSPIRRYPVPANVPIKVVAIHPYTNGQDYAIVTVKQDNVKTINLFPKKSKRSSASSF